MENNIDDIFKKGVEPLLTEPSDEFWKKASDNIILEGSKNSQKKTSRWRAVAFILAAGLLILGYVTYQTQKGLKNVEMQIAAVKQTENILPAKTKDIRKIQPVSNNSKDIASNVTKRTYQKKKADVAPNPHAAIATSNRKKSTSHNSVNKSKSTSLVASSKVLASKGSIRKSSINKSDKDKLVDQSIEASSPVLLNRNSQSSQLTLANQNTTQNSSESNKKIITLATTAAVSNTPHLLHDSVSSQTVKLPEEMKDSSQSKLGISAFFSPNFMMGYGLNATGQDASEMESAVKAEKEIFSYTTGIKLEYAISSNISINAGVGYSSYTFSVPSCNIYAQEQSGGDVGYSLVTSSGMINCPYYGYTSVGDSLNMSATSTRKYLSIPVGLKYYISNNTRFRFYLGGGILTNIALGQTTTMNWQDSWGQGKATVDNAVGIQQMYFCYEASIGVEFMTGKHFSVYAEPEINGAITSIDKNLPVVSYPREFSLETGITYHFK